MKAHAKTRAAKTSPGRAVARLDASALAGNYEAIREAVPGQAVLPMLKADGYGHDAEWVARQLLGAPNLYGFGLATLEEAAALRRALGARGRRARLLVFSGAAPWSEGKGQLCERFNLTPVIATEEDWRRFLRGGWEKRVPYEIKFNTGMNRLGLGAGLAREIARSLAGRPAEHFPSGICSHLALGETPTHPLSIAQRQAFERIRAETASVLHGTFYHLANSAGIWNAKLWRLDGLTDAVRPGLALYGVPPWMGAPARGLRPVMTLEAGVVAVRRLKLGESVGYGATFTVSGAGSGSEAVYSAIVSAGYGDGVHRALGSQGQAWLGGAPARFMGVVSMDLCAVHCSATTRAGDRVELLGPHIDPWTQARAAGTIPYELLTSVSSRVERVYE